MRCSAADAGRCAPYHRGLPCRVTSVRVLAAEVSHEACHAEQHYLVARSRAAQGASASEIQSLMHVSQGVADTAAKDPLPTRREAGWFTPSADGPDAAPDPAASWGDARGRCADAGQESIYGAGAPARNRLITVELPEKGRLNSDADHAAEAAKRKFGERSPEYAKAKQAWEAASAEFLKTYDRYQHLPEEADAWAVEKLLP